MQTYTDEKFKIEIDEEGSMRANYMNSCSYKVSNSEAFIIKHLVEKLHELNASASKN